MTNQRRKIVWVSGTFVLLLTLLLLVLFFTSEPTAQRRTLSQWLGTLDNPAAATNVQTITALRSMGGKAALRLVPMLDASDSQLKLSLVRLAQKQSLFQVRFVPAAVRHQRAVTAFEIMGDQAVAAAPALVSLLVRRGAEPPLDGDSASRASRALAALGHGAISSLRPALCSPQMRIRYEAINALQFCGYDHAPATMRDFFELLDDAEPRMRQAGVEIIPRVCASWPPELVIPRLARLLEDPNPAVRKQAAYALGRFGARASNSAGALRQACSDNALEVRQAAEAALTKIVGGAAMPGDANEPKGGR